MRRAKHTIYDQTLTKYSNNKQIHVKRIQEHRFLEINKSNAKNHTGLGWGGGIGVLLIALLIANAFTQPPYSRGLLKAPEEYLLINYCNIYLLGKTC